MVDFRSEHRRPYNLDQGLLNDVADLPEAIAGGWECRRRPATEIGQSSKLGGSRASPCGLNPYLINPETCGGLAVDEKN